MYLLAEDHNNELGAKTNDEHRRHDQRFVDNGHLRCQLYVWQRWRIEGCAIVAVHHMMIDSETGRTPKRNTRLPWASIPVTD